METAPGIPIHKPAVVGDNRPMETIAKNLWHDSQSRSSKPFYTYTGRVLLSYRGVQVFKNPAGSWDYVLNGATITQRAGFEAGRARGIIDTLLAGDEMSAPAVMAHIKASVAREAQ
jgi:hypothetical protein